MLNIAIKALCHLCLYSPIGFKESNESLQSAETLAIPKMDKMLANLQLHDETKSAVA